MVKKEKILNKLSLLFLKIEDPDEAYFNINRIVKRLNNKGIGIRVKEVQRRAYGCEEVKNNA